jgi:hypothetical protein
MSHYPGFTADPKMIGRQLTTNIDRAIQRAVNSPEVAARWKDQKNWPAEVREEFGDDMGAAAGVKHRAQVQEAVMKVRDAIDSFNPDFVLIWGDDQWENFHDDMVSPFAVYIWEEMRVKPHFRGDVRYDSTNAWNEPREKEFVYKGHTQAARFIVDGLMDEGLPVAYSYRGLHHDTIAHAHVNTLLYLDDDRRGFPYPVVPVHINCYGDRFVLSHGRGGPIDPKAQRDPKAPSPKLCFEMGQKTARILRDSPWRVVVVGSSSWSHGGLTKQHDYIYPDVEADKRLYERLKASDLTYFRDVTTAELDKAGQLEVPNWCALAGAMYELKQKAEVLTFAPTYVFNSSKAVAIFPPPGFKGGATSVAKAQAH